MKRSTSAQRDEKVKQAVATEERVQPFTERDGRIAVSNFQPPDKEEKGE